MGAGKSTAARQASGDALDADKVFEERHGKIGSFFDAYGEAAFREREEQLVLELLDRGGVVALGGGAIETPGIRAALRDHLVVWLDADVETCWRRVEHSTTRPLARDRPGFTERFDRRRPLYEEVAHAILPTATTVRPALSTLRVLPQGARMVWATSSGGEYPVVVGSGVRDMPAPAPGRAFTVTDEHVRQHWAPDADIVMLPGEAHKTLTTAERVWRQLIAAGATRADHLRAVGGGVVGDLTGFCAATYQRGVGVVQVPTTVVAQVDSSIGGKTGVDLPGAKNYVGAYHQPRAVLTDVDTLRTLPASEVAAGWAEVVKTALIEGGSLWERVRDPATTISEDVVFACARTKVRVVASDERDAGLRQVLNLGHTVGHALEVVSDFRLAHGPAVALGLLVALRLSGQDALRAEVAALLAAKGLPTTYDAFDTDAVLDATRRDKKRMGSWVPFVLVHAPGDVRHGQRVEDAAVRAAVEELRSS